MTAFFVFPRPHSSIVYTMPLYGGTTALIHTFHSNRSASGIPVPAGDTRGASAEAIAAAHDPCIVLIETPANPTLIMTGIRDAVSVAKRHASKPDRNGG